MLFFLCVSHFNCIIILLVIFCLSKVAGKRFYHHRFHGPHFIHIALNVGPWLHFINYYFLRRYFRHNQNPHHPHHHHYLHYDHYHQHIIILFSTSFSLPGLAKSFRWHLQWRVESRILNEPEVLVSINIIMFNSRWDDRLKSEGALYN